MSENADGRSEPSVRVPFKTFAEKSNVETHDDDTVKQLLIIIICILAAGFVIGMITIITMHLLRNQKTKQPRQDQYLDQPTTVRSQSTMRRQDNEIEATERVGQKNVMH